MCVKSLSCRRAARPTLERDRYLNARGTVQDFVSGLDLGGGDHSLDAIRREYSSLADFLAASKFATRGILRETNAIARLFRLFAVLLEPSLVSVPGMSLREYLRRPIALPDIFGTAITLTGLPEARTLPAPIARPWIGELDREAADLHFALESIAGAARGDGVRVSREGSGATTVTLTAAGVASLPSEVREVLSRAGIDLTVQPLAPAMLKLEAALAGVSHRATRSAVLEAGPLSALPAAPAPAQIERPYLRSSGVAELLVVKQHLLRYDRMDIAHVENVMAGEKKSRTFRRLERSEQTFVQERETTQERQTELSTAERFEMQREVSATIKQDQTFGLSLSLSGRYGPAVEFTSNAELDTSSSSEQTTRNSTEYAKDVMSRSLERVVDRVREEQRRTLIREVEETDFHEWANANGEHIIGTYQFLEKVYQSQVFNYGMREMFDFMVPEPASYLWALEKSPATELNLPEPPPRLELYAQNARAITVLNYADLAAKFGASGVVGPPPLFVTVSKSVKSGDGGNEEGHPRAVAEVELPVPPGYRTFSALVRPLALTDNELTIGVTVGPAQEVWTPRGSNDTTDVGSDHSLASSELFFYLAVDSHPYNQQGVFPVQILAFETRTFGVTVALTLLRTPQAFESWQVKTYDAISSAYQNALQKYDQLVAERRAAADAEAVRSASARFGSPPSQNLKTIRDELKKHCISILTRQFYDSFSATNNDVPPTFDFDAAVAEGSYVRFFEQAFEWDQIQYVFFPYYWARKPTWAERFNREEADPVLVEFLRAGSARVVAPVRPGFEAAVTHYLETGVIWNGLGDPVDVNGPLYVPITTEIRERTGAPGGEIPVGDPWLTHVPTVLAILRRESNLPQWERLDDVTWEWQEKND